MQMSGLCLKYLWYQVPSLRCCALLLRCHLIILLPVEFMTIAQYSWQFKKFHFDSASFPYKQWNNDRNKIFQKLSTNYNNNSTPHLQHSPITSKKHSPKYIVASMFLIAASLNSSDSTSHKSLKLSKMLAMGLIYFYYLSPKMIKKLLKLKKTHRAWLQKIKRATI